jgi:hypothetical protein
MMDLLQGDDSLSAEHRPNLIERSARGVKLAGFL